MEQESRIGPPGARGGRPQKIEPVAAGLEAKEAAAQFVGQADRTVAHHRRLRIVLHEPAENLVNRLRILRCHPVPAGEHRLDAGVLAHQEQPQDVQTGARAEVPEEGRQRVAQGEGFQVDVPGALGQMRHERFDLVALVQVQRGDQFGQPAGAQGARLRRRRIGGRPAGGRQQHQNPAAPARMRQRPHQHRARRGAPAPQPRRYAQPARAGQGARRRRFGEGDERRVGRRRGAAGRRHGEHRQRQFPPRQQLGHHEAPGCAGRTERGQQLTAARSVVACRAAVQIVRALTGHRQSPGTEI